MEVKLIVASGKIAGQEVPVPGPKFLIGRAADCHLRPHSDQISRHHCVILVEEGRVAVRDLDSRNGTLVNGQRIEVERELKTGDHLEVGPLDFEVRLGVPVGGKRKPKVKSIQEAAARTVEAAGASRAQGDELDVSQWLAEEDGAPARDTDTLEAAQTERVDVEPLADLPSHGAAAGPGGKKQRGDQASGQPAKFEPPKKPAAESSGEAAADVLREFFKRK